MRSSLESRNEDLSLVKPRPHAKPLVRSFRGSIATATSGCEDAYSLAKRTECVLNRVIDTLLAERKEFLLSRADHRGLACATVWSPSTSRAAS